MSIVPTSTPDGLNWPGTVYVLKDVKDNYLYVGISANVMTRINQHSGKPWWPRVKTIELTNFENDRDGREYERDLIEEHRPEFNVMHKPHRILTVVSADRDPEAAA